jgi:hypothetical protein
MSSPVTSTIHKEGIQYIIDHCSFFRYISGVVSNRIEELLNIYYKQIKLLTFREVNGAAGSVANSD